MFCWLSFYLTDSIQSLFFEGFEVIIIIIYKSSCHALLSGVYIDVYVKYLQASKKLFLYRHLFLFGGITIYQIKESKLAWQRQTKIS